MTSTLKTRRALGANVGLQTDVRRYVALLLAGVALLQVLWITVVPPFRGSDEFDHAYRAAGVAAGQWRAGHVPKDGRGTLVVSPKTLVEAAHAQCDALPYTGPDNCSPVDELGNGLVTVGSGAGRYNPAFYWVVGSAASPFTGAGALYAMRAVAALLCLVFVGMAAWAVAVRTRSTWSRIGLVVAITPVMVYSTALPAPNGLEMAAALAFWCSLLGFDGSLERRSERVLLVFAVLSAAVLMVDRTLGPLFALLILLTVWMLQPLLVRRAVAFHRGWFLGGAVVVLLAAAAAVSWFLMSGAGAAPPDKGGGEWHWTRLILWPLQTIAAFPFRDQAGHPMVYPVVLLIFAGLVVSAVRAGTRRQRLVLVATVVLSVGVPLVLTALTYSGRGSMWQGRYGLPYSMGIVLVAAHVLDAQAWSARLRPGLVVIGSTLMAIATAACFLRVLNDELGRSASISDPSWHAPEAWLVVVGSGIAWLLLYLAMARRQRVTP